MKRKYLTFSIMSFILFCFVCPSYTNVIAVSSSNAADNQFISKIELDTSCQANRTSEEIKDGINSGGYCHDDNISTNRGTGHYTRDVIGDNGFYVAITSFYFKITWGDACSDNQCSLVSKKPDGVSVASPSYFWCASSGDSELSSIRGYSITEPTGPGSDGKYHYKIIISPQDSSQQTVVGEFVRNTKYVSNHTLKLKAIDTSGNVLNESMATATVKHGGNGSVKAEDIDGYTYKGIKNNSTDTSYAVNSPTKEITKNNVTSDTTVYAVYEKNTFTGKTEVTDNKVSNNKTSTLGWTDDNGSMTKYIRCDNSSCSATYKHSLRQSEGENGTVSYTITDSNGQTIAQGSSTPGTNGKDIRNEAIGTIRPGDTYSETLQFERSIKDGNRTLTATVIAPYNFDNEVCLGTLENGECKEDTAEEIVYAGETASIQSSVIIGDRWNQTVGESYATSVPNAKTELRVRYNDGESYTISEELGTIAKGANNGNRSTSINVRDLPAGTKFTVQFCLYPKSSVYDTNITTNFGDDWACSNEKTFIIAKKPSFQVWGSGLYSAGKIDVPIARKTNIAGNGDYNVQNDSNGGIISFGSWVELGLIVDNTVEGLASGAGMGYGATSDAENPSATPNNLGGGSESFCKISTLTIPNVGCSNNKIGSSKSNSANASNASSDKSALISRFTDEDADDYILEKGSDYSLSYLGFSDIIKDDNTGKKISTLVYDMTGTFTIDGNITYDNDGADNNGYSSLESIPKIIIHAKNIYIDCGVTRVDAVLIADNDINTCADDDGNTPDINSADRSKQLVINGAIITDRLFLNRTYGAATGKNSIIPAEIINYDSSLYLWTNNESKSSNTGKLTQAYSRELAPRY